MKRYQKKNCVKVIIKDLIHVFKKKTPQLLTGDIFSVFRPFSYRMAFFTPLLFTFIDDYFCFGLFYFFFHLLLLYALGISKIGLTLPLLFG